MGVIKVGIMLVVIVIVFTVYYFSLKKLHNNLVVRIVGGILGSVIILIAYSIVSSDYLDYMVSYPNNEAIIQYLDTKKQKVQWQVDEEEYKLISTVDKDVKVQYYVASKQKDGKWRLATDRENVQVKVVNYKGFAVKVIQLKEFDKLYIDVIRTDFDLDIEVKDKTESQFSQYTRKITNTLQYKGYYKEIEKEETGYDLIVNDKRYSINTNFK